MKLWLAALLLVLGTLLKAHAGEVTQLHDHWALRSGCTMHDDGSAISSSSYGKTGWLDTTVPSTVLAAQVAGKQFPDPYFGMNLRAIPGTGYPIGHNFSNLAMPADSPYRCDWWYRTTFTRPDSRERSARTWLHFGGINYTGEIWINGQEIADSRQIAGAYRTYDFDITDLVRQENTLAVRVSPPTEKDLGINWVDWNPCPPDKDMGIWGEVTLSTTGPVTLRSPMVVTHFPDTTLSAADLTVYAELHNASAAPMDGIVSGTVAGEKIEQAVKINPHEDRTVVFDLARYPQLRLHHPRPWWPRQMGEPHLEHLDLSFTEGGAKSDEKAIDFGLREITSELTATGGRLFRVNGKPILIRGAGWSQDMLLRTDKHRLRNEMRLVQEMNLNTIRLEGKLETEDFFHLADERGILVMLGWCCCDHWEDWKTWTPEDLTIATASLRDQLLRFRSHPSVLVWLNGSDNAPPAKVERAYLDVESQIHWPNPVLSAAQTANTSGGGDNGVKMTGPYDYVAPSYWYVDSHNGGNFGFNTETSPGPAIPPRASREKFLPDPDAWPPSANWQFHFGGGEFKDLRAFDEAMNAAYAAPRSSDEYERIAQTMEYDSERAMFEAYGKNKYVATGVIQWMLNNAWPSMIWHLYDYYLDAGAGYFAAKKACEPIHIQYSYADHSIIVVNSTYTPIDNLSAKVVVHGIQWNELFKAESAVNSSPDSSQRILSVPDSLYVGPERVFLIDLTLTDGTGKVVSRNFYWVPGTLTTFDWARTDYTHTPALRHEDLTALTRLPKSQVTATAAVKSSFEGRQVLLTLSNPSGALAFQVHASIRTPSGALVAPIFWSDNWIELTPGENATLTAELPEDAPELFAIHVDGWNIEPTVVPLAPTAAGGGL